MHRVQFIEIHDQAWFPAFLRDAVTDDLQILLGIGKPYGDILPELREGIERSGADRVLDLCSGAGGPWPWLAEELKRRGVHVCVELSDKFPNEAARARARERFGAVALSRRAGGRGARAERAWGIPNALHFVSSFSAAAGARNSARRRGQGARHRHLRGTGAASADVAASAAGAGRGYSRGAVSSAATVLAAGVAVVDTDCSAGVAFRRHRVLFARVFAGGIAGVDERVGGSGLSLESGMREARDLAAADYVFGGVSGRLKMQSRSSGFWTPVDSTGVPTPDLTPISQKTRLGSG